MMANYNVPKAVTVPALDLMKCLFEKVVVMEYGLLQLFLPRTNSLLLMLAIYLCIFMAAKSPAQADRGGSSWEKSLTLQKEVRRPRVSGHHRGLFAVCWLPCTSSNYFTLFCPPVCSSSSLDQHIWPVSSLMPTLWSTFIMPTEWSSDKPSVDYRRHVWAAGACLRWQHHRQLHSGQHL
ncbi:adenosine receptor A2a [Lates japonicus]|uniref:Adenosine receptor A2a n=1 Tax=Lates japonicus TaxID=270547 RepID=A0AAD3MER2_LATJO|nr:adenosine receptor A2a [Lates japonicus]